MLALAVSACGSSDDDGSDTASSESTPDSTEDGASVGRGLIAKIGPSTVAVKGEDGDYHSHGTGVIIDAERGLVLTSNHITEGAENLTVTIGEKQTVKARPLARAMCKDLALIGMYSPRPSGLVALPFADSDAVQAGDAITSFGYPGLKTADGAEKLTATAGNVSAVGASIELTPLLPTFDGVIEHQAPLKEPNTGGPIVDAEGNFVGLNTVVPSEDSSGGLFYAIPSNQIRALYNELHEGETSFFAGWEKYHQCHGRMVRLARDAQVLNHDLPDGSKGKRETGSEHSGHSS
jgi:S1-C subfamily serine protease